MTAGPDLSAYDGLVVDLDGVVFRVSEPIAGATEALRACTLPVVFVTNNASRRPEAWAQMLAQAGLPTPPDRVVTSAIAAAALLARAGSPPTYAIGADGLRAALEDAGVPTVADEHGARAVAVGFDPDLSWRKLRAATLAIHRGARFVGTNADRTYPAPDGPWPGNGAALAYLTTATGVEPEVVGKPHPPLFELAANRLGLTRPLVVGDSLATDVAGAAGMGWDACLVLTGVTEAGAADRAQPAPRWVARDLAAALGGGALTTVARAEADGGSGGAGA